MRWKWLRALLVGALGLVAGGAVGCAEERPAVNKVQANALAKSFFVGANLQDPADDPEFWTRQMVVDVGYGAAQDGLFSASWAQAELTRIKWVIQEDLLIGRITYERIDDSDGKGAGAASKDGVIAVAFKILSHFDIRRAYNTTTGEESNVIEENTTDRPWYEREYMRVDWSKNLNTDSYDFDTLSLIGIFGGVTYEPLAYYVNDPNDEDAPHFDPDSGYFDITTKVFAKPEQIDLSSFGWGIASFPACYLDNDFLGGGAPSGTCNPVELTIRTSFRRVENHDYEPADWDGYRFQAYGPFVKERYGYARNYGMSDTKWHRFIARYNIWERSHYYQNPDAMTGEISCFTPETTPIGEDPHRDLDGNGTEDECEAVTPLAGPGSRCDTFTQKCTLPFTARKEVPQAWYVTTGSNDEFFDGTDWATHEWDVALRSAVMVAKYAECMRTGGADCQARFPVYHGQMDENEDAIALAREVDVCRRSGKSTDECNRLADDIGAQRLYDPGVIALAKMPEMLVLCHSPVEAGDAAGCGGPRLPSGMTAAQCNEAREAGDMETLATCRQALNVRMGDLRYHTVNNFKAPQSPSAWGIYTDSEDPLTGEKVSASINVWTHINDLWSQSVIDQIRYIKGELKTEDVTDGTYVRDWAAASEAASKGGSLPKLTKAELMQKIGATQGTQKVDNADLEIKKAKILSDSAFMTKLKDVHDAVRYIRADSKAATTSQAIYEARRHQAVGTDFEAQLMTKAMQQYAGVEGLPMTDAVMNYASPLRALNPTVQRQMKQLKELALADRGACVMSDQAADAPIALPALADVLEQKFEPFNPADPPDVQYARAERMRRFLAQRAQYAVIIHEMGHSIGMRHNFVSSYDAWGYRPQYWQLRTRNATVNAACTDLVANGETCVGPRYFDPMTNEERDNLIWMFMQSSTMDYAGETTQDMLGIGAYDFAAARMFYGGAVAVHEAQEYNANQKAGRGLLDWKTDNFGGIVGLNPTYDYDPNSPGPDGIHYSQLQKYYKLIDCAGGAGAWSGDDTAVQIFRPSDWNEERDGKWHPVLDGHIVKVNGQYSRCKQQKVDFVPWTSMRFPTASEAGQYYRGGPAVDLQNRTRVPYGFATDRWADLGNLSVYRHDNGADPYELFDFFITQQEISHIFDNYRRNRQSFSVRSSANRTLSRWNTKMRDGAKGLSLLVNIYKDVASENAYNADDLWNFIAGFYYPDNILAAGVAFDQFTRMTARPQPGDHYLPAGDTVHRALDDGYGSGPSRVTIPNGATGYYGDIAFGGKPLENALSDNHGEYDSEFTINAGCYYDKVFAPMLMAESVDNFISDSRQDFLDARYRSVSLADLFPDGYRRWLANNLTGDDEIKGVRIEADATGTPMRDPDGYPDMAMGWTSWWIPGEPEVCFPGLGSIVCSTYSGPASGNLNPLAPANVAIIDPQVGWEQQKFLIAMTLQYLPENEKRNWLDMMYVWDLQQNVEPAWPNRIELHLPEGMAYVAKTYGTETIFGKTVQKGIAARVLEWANVLLDRSYVTTPVTVNGATWYVPVLHSVTHEPIVKYDAGLKGIGPNGQFINNAKPGCGLPAVPTCTSNNDCASNNCDTAQGLCELTMQEIEARNEACTCNVNRSCAALEKYIEVPFFLRQAITSYGLCVDDDVKGIYDLPSCN